MPDVAEKMQKGKLLLQQGIKSKIFDLLGAAIVVALILVSLGVLERRDITLSEIGDIVIETVPFFFASMLLSNNYYMKGTFVGKTTNVFTSACENYTGMVVRLTGEQIDVMDEFCEKFNDDVLQKMQVAYLKRAAISYERFDKGKDNEEPLRVWSKHKLKHTLGDERAKWVQKAKNCKIKGLRVNTLLGTNDEDDMTNIGSTESQLSKQHTRNSAISYIIFTLILSMIGVRDIMQWGWWGAALVTFKCVFLLCKSYMEYFNGYNDITINLVHHINRKSDILKQFYAWYDRYLKINVENITTQDSNKNINS